MVRIGVGLSWWETWLVKNSNNNSLDTVIVILSISYGNISGDADTMYYVNILFKKSITKQEKLT